MRPLKTFSDRKNRAAVFVLALILSAGACLSSWPEETGVVPELPRLNFDNFLPAVRSELQKASAEAKARPTDASASGKLGMILQAHSQLEGAELCYRRAHVLSPAVFRWVYYLGWVQAAQGKYEEAAAALRQALRLDPHYIPAQLQLADCLLASARWESSAKLYEAILAQPGDHATAHYGLGRVRAARKDLSGAVESYRKACELFPDFGAAHYALALAYRDLGQTEKAQEQFGLYAKNKTGAPPTGDRLQGEVDALNESAVHQVRLGTELEHAGMLEPAAAAHEKALEIDPNLVEAHVNLISIYGRLGRFDKAEEHYRAAVRLNPNHAESHYDFGVLLFGLGKYAEAEQAFRRALDIDPFHPEAHNNLAYLFEQQGKLAEAKEHYRKAIENKPDYRLAHFHLGRILVNEKHFREGIEHLLKTLTPEDESTPGYLYALGAAYGRAGDRQNALRYLQSAREQASQRGQSRLLSSIERDLRVVEGGRP